MAAEGVRAWEYFEEGEVLELAEVGILIEYARGEVCVGRGGMHDELLKLSHFADFATSI